MTDYSAKDVADYIARAAEEARPHLREIRALVKAAAPEAEEGLSYGKPYYKHHGMLAGFDAYKDHVGFEIWADKLAPADRKALEDKGYKTGSRTFHIGYDQKVPVAIITRMVKAQAKANKAKSEAKKR